MNRTAVSIVFLIALLVGPNAIVSADTRGGRGNELQGIIYVGPTASGEALRILSTAYALRPLRSASALGPIIVGANGLKISWVVDRLKATYEAHNAVGLTNATPADIERLRNLLGHQGSVGHPEGKTVDLAAFRNAPRPDGQFHWSSHILLPRVSGATAVGSKERQMADENDIKGLNRIFSATPVLPEPPPPSDSSQQNLLQIADSYEFDAVQSDSVGDQAQIINTLWAARSFMDSADFYYSVSLI